MSRTAPSSAPATHLCSPFYFVFARVRTTYAFNADGQACDHPSLVTKSLDVDRDALENEPAKEDGDKEGDDLAAMMSGLGVTGQKKCEICFAM